MYHDENISKSLFFFFLGKYSRKVCGLAFGATWPQPVYFRDFEAKLRPMTFRVLLSVIVSIHTKGTKNKIKENI